MQSGQAAMGDSAGRKRVFVFGSFRLFRAQKVLLDGGRPVRLGSRALDLLVALVERAGEVVTKNELLAYAWPTSLVEEGNLRVHIAMLRKILGDGQGDSRFIVNITGRGYSFVAPVTYLAESAAEPFVQAMPQHNLPSPRTQITGRSEAIRLVAKQVTQRRLVTIVGPGGIGKSTVAIAVAEQLMPSFIQEVRFVDLASIDHPAATVDVIAASIGIPLLADPQVGKLIAYLQDERVLLIFDNCEHVIEQAADVVERILRETRQVSILATSREPLRVAGELVHSLPNLPFPDDSPGMTAASALAYPAVQLFVRRAVNSHESFEFTDDNAGAVAGICRRLEGIPLAIEIVAAHVNRFSVHSLQDGHGDRLLLGSKGRRSSSSRHQSLRATLDWSYQLLSATEQNILRGVSVFRTSFTSSAAAAVVLPRMTNAGVVDGLLSLVSKSLLTSDLGDDQLKYRLLYLARLDAQERLAAANERPAALRRHAQYISALLAEAMTEWWTLTINEWQERYRDSVDDIRAALEWAFSPDGDIEIGTTLLVTSLPFVVQLSPLAEFSRRRAAALAHLAARTPARPVFEFELQMAYALLVHESGASIQTALTRAIELSRELGVAAYKIDALSLRWVQFQDVADIQNMTESLEQLATVVQESDDPSATLHYDRIAAQTFHWAGDQRRARQYAQRTLRHPSKGVPLVYGLWSIDRRVSLRTTLARVLWLEGKPDQALTMAEEALELVRPEHPNAMLRTLQYSCAVACWRGELTIARALSKRLLVYARSVSLEKWIKCGTALRDTLEVATDDPPLPAEREIPDAGSRSLQNLLCSISEKWVDGVAIARAENGQAGWCAPEILRVAATRLHTAGTPDCAAEAEQVFKRSLSIAQEQGALAWELRSTTSLALLLQSQGRCATAMLALTGVYERFTEGFETADMIAARSLIRILEKSV